MRHITEYIHCAACYSVLVGDYFCSKHKTETVVLSSDRCSDSMSAILSPTTSSLKHITMSLTFLYRALICSNCSIKTLIVIVCPFLARYNKPHNVCSCYDTVLSCDVICYALQVIDICKRLDHSRVASFALAVTVCMSVTNRYIVS